jgi:hypothetical protein
MYFVNVFDEKSGISQPRFFDSFESAKTFAIENGYQKFRDLIGNEYFI